MKLIEVRDYEEMSQLAAKLIIEQVQDSSTFVMGLATGATPIGTYEQLIKAHREGISFGHVETFNLDEYVGLAKDHPESYHYFMDTHLFQHLDIPKENIHLLDGMAPDIEAECQQFEQKIQSAGGIDLQLLGIGVNGHIGFNEPYTPFDSLTHVTELTQETKDANAKYFASPEQVPSHAMTMGIGTIMRSRRIILLISGKNKAEILAKLLESEVSESLPASILKTHPQATLIADQDALSLVKKQSTGL